MDKKTVIKKHNKLLEARYKLNLNEQKIILYAISKLTDEQTDFNILRIEMKEFINLLGTTKKRYTELSKIIQNLMSKQVRIETDEKDLIANWVSSIDYKKNTGLIELEFSKKLIPYLLRLETLYKGYQLENIIHFKNKYSIRIYELLKQWESVRKKVFDINKLKEMIGCEGKYNDFRNFKRYVLEPAKKELLKYSDIKFNYETITGTGRGRKVIKISFDIIPKPKLIDEKSVLINALYSDEQINDIKSKCNLHNEKLTKTQVIELYEIACEMTLKYELDPFKYMELNYKYSIGKAKHIYSYLKKALKEDYANAIMCMKLLIPNATTT